MTEQLGGIFYHHFYNAYFRMVFTMAAAQR